MFTFDKEYDINNVPIGRIIGGKYDRKILHINTSGVDNLRHKDDIENIINSSDNIIDEDEIENTDIIKLIRRKRDRKHKTNIMRRKLLRSRGTYKDMDEIRGNNEDFYKVIENLIKIGKKELKLYDGKLVPLPNIHADRNTMYIAGPSGSGKSTIMSLYCNEYKQIYPERKMYMISECSDDPAFDGLDINRIPIGEDLLNEPIVPDEIPESLIIFDDTDTILDDKIRKIILKMKEKFLQTGRKYKIDVLISSHTVTDYKKTKKILSECENIIVFPRCGEKRSIKYVLKEYVGFDKNIIKRIMDCPSRWVLINKRYPNYILYTLGAFIPE